MTAPAVSILIPAYNEAPTIDRLLEKVVAHRNGAEIIVADDASTDGTGAILDRWAAQGTIRLIRHAKNQGKGAAVRSALAQAQGEIILIQDADLEYDPEDYPVLLKPLLTRRAEVVFGSRFLGAHRASYVWHRLGNWLLTNCVNVLFNASLTDMETGYKAFHRTVLEGMTLQARGFEFEPEFTCRVLRRGHLIFEVPISYYGRTYAEGKKITWQDGFHALWTIVRLRF